LRDAPRTYLNQEQSREQPEAQPRPSVDRKQGTLEIEPPRPGGCARR
jgi:hypothetical protein